MAISPTVVAMCVAGLAVIVIGLAVAAKQIAAANGVDKFVALANVCVAAPLAVFGALHLFGPSNIFPLVPAYMPWRMFWVYLVGCGLIAAALSIAVGIAVRWSGLLFGTMMLLFVAMIHFPGALRQPDNRIIWTIVFRESAFGGAGWILAGLAMTERRGRGDVLVGIGRALVTITAIMFGVEHFLHPLALPGVPLVKEMPAWVPFRPIVDYVTGAALLATGVSVVLGRHVRTVAACVGGWLLLMLLAIYAPVLFAALSNPAPGVELEGVNYFADTLLFTGAILTLARAGRA
jgi:uncharacterized membrane protein YphA (DoxX/SURF4 family)